MMVARTFIMTTVQVANGLSLVTLILDQQVLQVIQEPLALLEVLVLQVLLEVHLP